MRNAGGVPWKPCRGEGAAFLPKLLSAVIAMTTAEAAERPLSITLCVIELEHVPPFR